MNRCDFAVAGLLLMAVPAAAHHIWIIPASDGAKARAVFSDNLEPSNTESIKKVVPTKLWVRERDGNEELVEWTRVENAFTLEVPGKGARTVGGVCSFGVETYDHRLQKHGEPYLLKYYPKTILGEGASSKPWDKLTLEIVPVVAGDEVRLQVFFQGKPAANAEMRVQAPGKERENLKADEKAEIRVPFKKPGMYAFQTRYIEHKGGAFHDKKYVEVRHHATLVLPLGMKPNAEQR